MNKIENYFQILMFLIQLCIIGLFIYAWQTKKIGEKKAEQITVEKANQMYYEEMFPELKMNLFVNDPFIIIPAYDEMFILKHPELKKYFVRKVSPQEILSTNLNIDFSDGTWQLSVDERTNKIVRAQFSKDGKFVLVCGMKEGNSIINISRENETYSGSIIVRVEEPEEWYEKLQEDMKFQHLPMPTSQKE